MTSVFRIDATGALQPPRKEANGWLRVDAYLTRTGVFEYHRQDGSVLREYRPADEVFKTDSVQSFALTPVTDEHPPAFLTAANTTQYSRGSVSAPRADGSRMRAELLITDAALVAKLEGKQAQQVSCGYVCDLEMTPGVAPDGTRYDAVQRNIRGNHVAIVPTGRAGPDIRVRMDGAEVGVLLVSQQQPSTPEKSTVKQIRIDGIDYDVSTDTGAAAAAQALAKQDAKQAEAAAALSKQLAEAKAHSDKLQAKLDANDADVAKLKKEIAELPERLRKDAAARVELETKAKKVLGAEAKLDGLDTKAIHAAVVAKAEPSLKLDGKSEVYVEALFDRAVEKASQHTDSLSLSVQNADDKATTPAVRFDRESFKRAGAEAWKTLTPKA